MVAAPEDYAWSSCRRRLGLVQCEWLDDDPCYLSLGNNAEQQRDRHREYLHAAIPEGEWQLLREAVQRGQLTGHSHFVDKVEEILGKRIEKRLPGRPRKNDDELGRSS
jgi:putative transposase